MRRLAAAFAILAFAAATASPQDVPPSKLVLDQSQINVLDANLSYGAGRVRDADDSAAFQAAIEGAAALAGPLGSAAVLVPDLPNNLDGSEGYYTLTKPLFADHSRINLSGGARRPMIRRNFAGPAFIVGQGRGNTSTGFPTVGHWADAFGVMDASYASASGQRWGVRNYDPAVRIQGTATGGTFTLSYLGQATGDIPWNATAAQLQAALAALSTIGAGNVTCTGGPLPSNAIAYDLTDPNNPFTFNLAPPLTVPQDGNGNPIHALTGTSPLPICGQAAHVSFSGHGFTHPNNSSGNPYLWASQRKTRIDLAVSSPNWLRCQRSPQGGANGIPVAGLGDLNDNYAPWGLTFQNNGNGSTTLTASFALDVSTSNSPYWKDKEWLFQWQLDGTVPLHRITVQTDLDAGTIQIWDNRVKVAVSANLFSFSDRTSATKSIASDVATGLAGSVLRDNEAFALNVLTTSGLSAVTTGQDVTLFGMRVSRDNPYVGGGATGSTQALTSGLTLNDANQFINGNYVDEARMLFTDPPSSLFASTFPSGTNVPGFGLVVVEGPNLGAFENITIERLNIVNFSGYGADIAVGTPLNLVVRDCAFSGGSYGIGSLPGQATSYPWTVSDCIFTGSTQAGIFNAFSFGQAERLQFQNCGRTCMLGYGNVLNTKDVFANPSANAESIVKVASFANPGGMSLENWIVDYEGGGPTRAYFEFEETTFQPGTWSIKNMSLGSLRSGGSMFLLRGPGTDYPTLARQPQAISISGLQVGGVVGDLGTIVDAQTAPWFGEVINPVGTPWKWVTGPGAVRSRHNVNSLPSIGAYDAGKAIFDFGNYATTGDPVQSVVKAPGDFSTTPPTATPSITGGSIPSATYAVCVSYLHGANPQVEIPSASLPASATVASGTTGTLAVTPPSPLRYPDANNYYVYVQAGGSGPFFRYGTPGTVVNGVAGTLTLTSIPTDGPTAPATLAAGSPTFVPVITLP